MAEIKNDPQLLIKADETKKIELQMAKMCDITIVVSTNEQQILKKEDPLLNVQVISLIHPIILPTKKFSERRDLLFLGAFLHTPNADSALWFIHEIFPKIKIQKPDIKIFIVGDRPTDEVLSLSSDDVIVTGYVEDLSEYFNNCRVFVAPLRFGAGVKGKINQSMSCGLPVVTTSIGAEGMGIVDGTNVLIADDPELFSQKVIKLYDDEKLWDTISINSIEHIRNNTSYEQSKIRIKEFIDTL
jgi:glycosyltransferase involved in cell wall biosynthesis